MKIIYIDEEGLSWHVIKKNNETCLECLDIPGWIPIEEIKRMNIAVLQKD